MGSRTISKYSDLKLSSATIRNEMSDLEEKMCIRDRYGAVQEACQRRYEGRKCP